MASAHVIAHEANQDEVARRLEQLVRDTLSNLRLAFALEHESVPEAFRRAFAGDG